MADTPRNLGLEIWANGTWDEVDALRAQIAARGGGRVIGWTYRVVWPVEDDQVSYRDAVAFATGELSEMADRDGVRLLGDPTWELVEHDDPDRWPHVGTVLVAVADAMPAHPTEQQWVELIRGCVEQGQTDVWISRRFGLSTSSVQRTRSRHGIPPAVPQGYRSREQVRDGAWRPGEAA